MKLLLRMGIGFVGLVAGAALSAAEFQFGNQILKVPDGFTVERVTTTNLVKRPVTASFDEQGRLYVTDSSGSSEKGRTQYEQKNHRVMRLEDTNGDGVFDQSIEFADNMMFPEGCLYYDGSVYVGAPPSIWKLTDTDGDGVADKREEWHKGISLTGCANDIHGPYLGPDGWLYWTKGAFSNQTYTINGKPWSSRAAHIFRARPDHSGMEPVLTGGMDNPVSVAFSPEGERFLAGTFFEPQIPGRRDGVIHAIYGGVYGKPNDVLEPHKKTGDLMPVMTHLGASASCDVIFYRSKIFGDDFQNNMLVANFNLHNVTRHVLEPDGATFKTKDSVFLTCENDPDFHPTCVIEDADGSLLVVDTGGWYKICCPTSQLYKPDVLGAIYRVRKNGAPKVEDPRGLKIEWARSKPGELTKLLDDPRPAVVERAIQTLAKGDEEAIDELVVALGHSREVRVKDSVTELRRRRVSPTTAPSVEKRRNALWTLTRMDHPEAHRLAEIVLLRDNNESVRRVALYSIGLWRTKEAATRLNEFLRESYSAQLRRLAAEAIGRCGDPWAIHFLLNWGIGQEYVDDRVLEHSIIYAMIELNAATNIHMPQYVYPPDYPGHRAQGRAVLIARDQMDNGGLKPEIVVPLLLSADKRMKETALWIVSHNPEWGDSLAGFFRERLKEKTIPAQDQNEIAALIARFAGNASVQELLANALASDATPRDSKLVALKAMASSGLREAPASWTAALKTVLSGNDASLIPDALRVVRLIAPAKGSGQEMNEVLLRVAKADSRPANERLSALAAIRPALSTVEPRLFDLLRAHIAPNNSVETRDLATTVLAKAKLNSEQLVALADSVKEVGPMEVLKLLSAFEHSTDETVGLKLIASLKESKAASSLRADTLKPKLAKFPASVQTEADALLASLNTDAETQKKHIDELLPTLKGGDIRRGQTVFNSTKAACASCHRIGYLGGNVGPDLTSISQARNERDLLEAIVYPSATFVRSYEPVIVKTKSDEDYSGVLRRDAADEIVIATGPNTEVRIARAEITEMRPGAVSVMPAGLDQQLTKQELADLLAFLKRTKWDAN